MSGARNSFHFQNLEPYHHWNQFSIEGDPYHHLNALLPIEKDHCNQFLIEGDSCCQQWKVISLIYGGSSYHRKIPLSLIEGDPCYRRDDS